MKILIIHNEYQQRGGEFQAVKDHITLLKSQGHQVIEYIKDSRQINSYSRRQFVNFLPNSIYSYSSYKEIKKIVQNENPDIAHIHNVFPLISPSVYKALHSGLIPIIQTVHNFRFLCPNGLFFVNQKICELCKYGNTSYSVLKKCFRESYGLSSIYALSIGGNRLTKTFNLINQFIVLTEFSAQKLVESRLTTGNKISVLGNFIASPLPNIGIEGSREEYVVYIGRLSPEKGVRLLFQAGKLLKSTKILVIGTGPEMSVLQDMKVEDSLSNIKLLGHITGEDKWDYIRKASAVIIPSICYETFSITSIEAMSVGTPVVASRLGSLPYVIEDGKTGLLFEPGNHKDLAYKISQLISKPELVNELGINGRRAVEEKFSEVPYYKKLIHIYQEAIS